MKKIFLVLVIMVGVSPAMAKKNRYTPTAQKALLAMSRQYNEGSVLALLKSKMSKEDARFVNTEVKRFHIDLKKKLPIKIGRDSIIIAGVPGPIQVRAQGTEITYHNVVLKMDSRLSFEANVKNFEKKLSLKTSWLDLFIPKAEAAQDFEYGLADAAAFQAAKTLTYIGDHINDQDFRDHATLASDQQLNDLFGNMYDVEKNGIQCSDNAGKYDDKPVVMTIQFKNGSKTTLVATSTKTANGGRTSQLTMHSAVDNMAGPDRVLDGSEADDMGSALSTACLSSKAGDARKFFDDRQDEENSQNAK